MTDRGLITRAREMEVVYGVEDIIWDNLIHEQVSCIYILYGALLEKKSSFRDQLIHD